MIVFAGTDTNRVVLESLCSARDVPTISITPENHLDPNFEIEFKTTDRIWERTRRQILVHGPPGAAETAEAIRTAIEACFAVFITPADPVLSTSDYLGLNRFMAQGVEPVPIEHLQWELSR